MWIIVIIAIIAYVLIRFFSDYSKQESQIKKEGGVRKKYSTLINEFLQAPNARVFKDEPNCVMVGVNNAAGADYYIIMQTFDTVTVQHVIKNNPLFGSFRDEYSFPKNMDQNLMLSKISQDLERKINTLLQRGNTMF